MIMKAINLSIVVGSSGEVLISIRIDGVLVVAVTWITCATFLVAVKAGGVGEHGYVALFCSTVIVAAAMLGNACVAIAADKAKRAVLILGAA